MNVRVITKNIGLALLLDAGFMLLSALVAAVNHFDSSFSPLLLSGILTLTVGILPIIFVGHDQNTISTREGFTILFFAWFLSCVFGMMPYALWGGEFSLVNSWFESVSGFTTTGATILNNIEALPKGLLFWRSATHFIGGLGVVVFMLVILPSSGSIRLKMSHIEVSDMSAGNYNFRSNKLVRVVLSVYLAMIAAAVVLYVIGGMPLFDAVNHAFSVVATGGFSTRNASIGAYGSHWIELISVFFMIVSSLHYGLLYTSIVGRSTKLFRNPIVKFFLFSLLVGVVLVSASLIANHQFDNPLEAVWQALFNVVSIGTSTGFATVDTSVWPVFTIFMLLYFSVQCGCSGSTSGGLKADRVWVLAKALKAQIIRTIYPNAVIPVKFGSAVADSEQIGSVALYTILYIVIIIICALVYAACGMDMTDSFTSAVAMVGNIGPAFGSVGSVSNFDAVSTLAKVVMGIEMIVGRLGLYAALSMVVRKKL